MKPKYVTSTPNLSNLVDIDRMVHEPVSLARLWAIQSKPNFVLIIPIPFSRNL